LVDVPAVQRALLSWYARARRDLPWRRTRDPYAIWLSEVMLQQTRVETVIPYYERFLAAYPTLHALAEAPLEDVLGLWSGLGYYRRARLLHAAARSVEDERGGLLPHDAAGLLALPGVGRYTAGAVASIAWGEPVPVVDGNVARVLSRLFAVKADLRSSRGAKRLWDLAVLLVAVQDPSSWNQALMELGATICSPERPRCADCPVQRHCLGLSRGQLSALPPPSTGTRPRPVSRVGFVLRARGRVLLARRTVGGLFGGMWEPPSLDDGAAGARRSLLELARRSRARGVGAITHVLTHRRIEMVVYAGRGGRALLARLRASPDYDAFAWVPHPPLARHPLTSLARKMLTLAGVQADRAVAARAREVHSSGE
jgi:A/G-specific adenine glycosylase